MKALLPSLLKFISPRTPESHSSFCLPLLIAVLVVLASGKTYQTQAQIYDKRKLGVGDTLIIVHRDSCIYEGLVLREELNVKTIQLLRGDTIEIKNYFIIRQSKWTSDPKKRKHMTKYPSRRETRMHPEYNRYLFTGNYLPLDRRSGYLTHSLYTSFGFRYAATDYVSVGFGAEVISAVLFGNFTNSVISMSPKVTIPINDRWYMGGSLNYVFNLNNYISDAKGDYGFGLLGATYGNRAGNLTANLGWVTEAGQIVPSPLLSLNGMIRFSPKSTLVSENVLIPFSERGYTPVASLGIRQHVGKRLKRNRDITFGIIFIYAPGLVEGDVPVIPVFDITAAFDKKRKKIQH